MPTGPHLALPPVIDIPYVVAGQGGATAEITIANDGDAPLTGLAWSLGGDPSISLAGAPSILAPGQEARISLTCSGSTTEAIVEATLAISSPSGEVEVLVFAVAGDPGLGPSTWERVEGAGGVTAGAGVTVAMPAAPFPDGVAPYTDPSVRVFLPEGYRDRGAHDLIVHFHGWNATLASTLASHRYQEHLYASGSNAVLVVPQGPVGAPSGDFGKLMKKGGLSRLLTQVLVVLYRDGKITRPVRGDVVITSHSGGYRAAAAALDPANDPPSVRQIDLFDSLYGDEASFEAFALAGGSLRSSYTERGGTLDHNRRVATWLEQEGLTPATGATQRAMRADPPVVAFAATTHDGTTRVEGAYGEQLRWRLRRSRRGPRIELRQVIPSNGRATARWLSPADEDLTGFVVETSPDGVTWTAAATAAPTASEATFPLGAGSRVRIRPVMIGIDPDAALPSDTYRVDPGARVLVVDGFDRILDGSFGGLHHDFAARIGEAVGPVASISHRAVTEDGFDLTAWRVVVWLLGDQSTWDHTFTAAEQAALLDYVGRGGHLVASGSEVGYELGPTAAGASFLDACFGARYVADDARSREVVGSGPLASIASFGVGGPGAPYAAASPDALGATPAGQVVLAYRSGEAAAVGLAGRSVLVGFPLELVPPGIAPSEDPVAPVAAALLAFAGGT